MKIANLQLFPVTVTHWTFGANLTAVLDRLPPAAAPKANGQEAKH